MFIYISRVENMNFAFFNSDYYSELESIQIYD